METMSNVTSYRTHRVGTITTGFAMVVFGVLLLLHSVFGFLEYELIFALWPMILIGLGIELLLSNVLVKQIIYDKASILLLFLMTIFAIGMAAADICMEMMKLYPIHV